MRLKNTKLHREDKAVVVSFIDYVRLKKSENVGLEIGARYVAEHIGVNPNQSNARLANRFVGLLESKKIK